MFNYRWEESSSAFHCYVPSRFRAEYLNQAIANREQQQRDWKIIQNNNRQQEWFSGRRYTFLYFFCFYKNSVFQPQAGVFLFFCGLRLKYSYNSYIKRKVCLTFSARKILLHFTDTYKNTYRYTDVHTDTYKNHAEKIFSHEYIFNVNDLRSVAMLLKQ